MSTNFLKCILLRQQNLCIGRVWPTAYQFVNAIYTTETCHLEGMMDIQVAIYKAELKWKMKDK